MEATRNGTNLMVQQPARRGWSPDRGFLMVKSWKGPKDAAYGLEFELRSGGIPYETQENGPNAIVTATYSKDVTEYQETPTKLWERHVNRIEKSVYEHPSVALLGVELITDIQEAIRLGTKRAKLPFSSEYALAVWNFLTKGIEAFPVEQPVVTLNEIASTQAVLSIAKSNIGKIINYDQMVKHEKAPVAVLDNKTVPEALLLKPKDALLDLYRIIYGYRKSDPTITQAPFGKWQCQTQYEAGFYPEFFYEFATYPND